jgi:hypothetical protein
MRDLTDLGHVYDAYTTRQRFNRIKYLASILEKGGRSIYGRRKR